MSLVLTAAGWLFMVTVGVSVVALFTAAALGRFWDWRDSRKRRGQPRKNSGERDGLAGRGPQSADWLSPVSPLPSHVQERPLEHTHSDCRACAVKVEVEDLERIWTLR